MIEACHDFAKLAFIKWSTRCQMVSCDSTKDHREIEIEKFMTCRSWRKYMAPTAQGTTQWGQDRAQAERGRDWAHVFTRVHVQCFEVPELRLDGSIQTKRSSFGKPHRGCQSQGLLGKSWQGPTFACDSAGCCLGLCSHKGWMSVWGSAGCLAKQNGCRVRNTMEKLR